MIAKSSNIKILAMLLALTMLFALVSCQKNESTATESNNNSAKENSSTEGTEKSGDSNFNPTGYPIVNEKVTIKITGPKNVLSDSWKDTIMVKEIEEKFNIILDCNEYSAEEWSVQKGLIFASEDLPDLFVSAGFSLAEVADYGSQGFLIPLNDLIEKYGENTKVVFKKNPAMKSMSTSPDGNIYTLLIGSAIPANLSNRNWINEVWIKNVGMEYPKTLDDLYNLFKAFKEQDANGNGNPNDEIPTSGRVLDEIILNALGIPVKSSSGLNFYLKDGTPTVICTDDLFKVYLEYMRKFYAEELLDNATFIQSFEELTAKIAEGRVGAYQVAAPWLYESEKTAWDYMYFGGLTSEYNNKPIVGASNGIDAVGNVAITNVNKYPEATYRLLDYFYSDEGSTFGFIGSENVGWKWEDKSAGTWSRVIPEGWTDTDEAYRHRVLIIAGFNIYRDKDWKLFKPTGNNIWLYEQYEKYAMPYFADVFPNVVFTEEEQKKRSTLTTDINSYVNESVVRFIIGEIDIESGWSTFQETLKNMGIDDVVKIYTEAYNRYSRN